MDDQQMMNQEAGMMQARTAYMQSDNNEINSLLRTLTDPEDLLIEMENSLRGKAYDAEGKLIQVAEPLMNDRGVSNMLRLARSCVNKILLMSNFTEEKASDLTLYLGFNVISALAINRKDYAIKSHQDCSDIVQVILNPVYSVCMSAKENGTRRMLRSTIVESSINTQGQPIKSKNLGGLFGGKVK